MQAVMLALIALVSLVTKFTTASPVVHLNHSIPASAQWAPHRAHVRDIHLNHSIPASAQWAPHRAHVRDIHLNHSIPASAQWAPHRAHVRDIHSDQSIPASAQWGPMFRGHGNANSIPSSEIDKSWKWWTDFMASRGCDSRPTRIDCVVAKKKSETGSDVHARQFVTDMYGDRYTQCQKDIAKNYDDVESLNHDDLMQMRADITGCTFTWSNMRARRDLAEDVGSGRCSKDLLEDTWRRTQSDLTTADETHPVVWWAVLMACLRHEPSSPFSRRQNQPGSGPFEFGPPGGQECVEDAMREWTGIPLTKDASNDFVSAVVECIHRLPK